MRRVYVILNPVAGRSEPRVIRGELNKYLGGIGWEYQVYETTGQEDIRQIVQTAINEGYELFLCVGGDGTVSGVASGLVNTSIPLGILPMGTGNSLARDLGIPLDLDGALALLVNDNREKGIDAMRMEGDHYFLNVGIGVSAAAVRELEYKEKRRMGRVAYLLAGIGHLFGWQPHRFQIRVNGRNYSRKASEIMILNSGAIGKPYFHWGPKVAYDDGRLDVRIVRARTAWAYFRLGWNMFLKRQKQDPSVTSMIVEEKIDIRAEKPLPVQADGEFVGETPIQVQVVPNSVRMIVPLRGDDRR